MLERAAIGKRIRDERIRLGIRFSDMAASAGLDIERLAAIETGQADPTDGELDDIRGVFLAAAELLGKGKEDISK